MNENEVMNNEVVEKAIEEVVNVTAKKGFGDIAKYGIGATIGVAAVLGGKKLKDIIASKRKAKVEVVEETDCDVVDEEELDK